MFVIVNSKGFVSNPDKNGTGHSYDKYLQKAKLFETEALARREKCGDEVIISVREVMEAFQ